MDKVQNINIENFHGVLGDVDNIDILSTGENTQNIIKKDNPILIDEDKQIEEVSINYIDIELDEINGISNNDKQNVSLKIKKAIQYFLEDKRFSIQLTTNRYKAQLEHYKETSDERNTLLKYTKSNNANIKKAENILNSVIETLNELFSPNVIELILKGIIEYFKKETYSDTNKVSFGRSGLKFYCYTRLLDNDMNELENRIQNEIGMPYHIVDFDSGFDIHDLPYNAKYTKAIPTILFEMYNTNIDLSKLKEYLHLRIGN